MGIKSHILDCSEEKASKVSKLCEKMENTREKMEKETHIFIEATKNFSLKWVQREMDVNIHPLKNEDYSENVEIGIEKLSELSNFEDLPSRIQDIVEVHLNRDDYWIHRGGLLQADTSCDYIEFKKEKIRKALTSSIRMILGCAAEIFADLKKAKLGDRIWIKERGKRKYICILRFSDEMTASLDRYFIMFEELLILESKIKEIEKNVEKRRKRKLKKRAKRHLN